MYTFMLFVLGFSYCCFSQQENIINQDDNTFPGEQIKTLGSEKTSSENNDTAVEILRELGAKLTKDLRKTISVILADMVDMKEKMAEMADTKVKMEQMKEWLYKDLQQLITGIQADMVDTKAKMEDMVDMKEKMTEIVDKMADLMDMKKKILRNEGSIAENSDTIYDVNSTLSAQITSVSMDMKQQKESVESLTSSDQKQNARIEDIIQRLNSIDTETRKSPVKCRPGWTPYREKCYRVTDDCCGWDESLAHCLSAHSTLASVHDRPTNDFLYNLAPSSFWLGGVRTGPGKDDFAWVDQSPFDYTNWLNGQPDNSEYQNRIEMRKGRKMHGENAEKMWNDYPKEKKLVAI